MLSDAYNKKIARLLSNVNNKSSSFCGPPSPDFDLPSAFCTSGPVHVLPLLSQ